MIDSHERRGAWHGVSEVQLTDAEEVQALLDEGHRHINSSDEEPALAIFLRALAMVKPLSDPSLEADALNAVALAYFRRGSFGEARSHFQRARDLVERLGDVEYLAMLDHNIGMTHLREEAWEAALPYFERAVPGLRDAGQRVLLPTAMHGVALSHDRLGRPERALEEYGRVVQVLADGANPNELAKAYENIARLHRRYGRHAEAYENVEKALAVHREAGPSRQGGRRVFVFAAMQALRVGRPLDVVRHMFRLGVHLMGARR
jgi:tetratricopeptide (TPR) repeat protein